MSLKRHPLYRCWRNMRERCYLPDNKDYERYGGRGIVCCERWASFINFLADMGDRPSPKHSLERIDNAGNYEPGNVKWATPKEQARNRRNSRVLVIEGKSYNAGALEEEYGIHRNIIYERASRNLPFHEVIHKGRIKWGSGRPVGSGTPKTHCPQGHEYTAENVIWKNKEKTHKGCRICHYERIRIRNLQKTRSPFK